MKGLFPRSKFNLLWRGYLGDLKSLCGNLKEYNGELQTAISWHLGPKNTMCISEAPGRPTASRPVSSASHLPGEHGTIQMASKKLHRTFLQGDSHPLQILHLCLEKNLAADVSSLVFGFLLSKTSSDEDCSQGGFQTPCLILLLQHVKEPPPHGSFYRRFWKQSSRGAPGPMQEILCPGQPSLVTPTLDLY